MPESIKHFMWGYQSHFRSILKHQTAYILDQIMPGLNSDAFVVGVKVKKGKTTHPANVEPEHNHWAFSSDLYDVLEDVGAIAGLDPEKRLIQSLPIAQQNQDERVSRRALQAAVVGRLKASPLFPSNTLLFASTPVERDDLLVMSLITVDEKVFNAIPRIEGSTIWLHKYRSFEVPTNLAEAVIEQILERANASIIQPDAGAGLVVIGEADPILRVAGAQFLRGLLNRVDKESLMHGASGLFDTMSDLSVASYERAEAKGRLILAEKTSPIGTVVLEFIDPIPTHRARTLRKLLAMSDEKFALRCDSSYAFSLIQTNKLEAEAPYVTLNFEARGRWAVTHGKIELMVVTNGRPSLPKPIVCVEDVVRDLRRVFSEMPEAESWRFAHIAIHMAESGHGGILVVSESAQTEAARLGDESLPVAPQTLTPELAPLLTRIDGAILCDPNGTCHGVGVILDGKASKRGDPGRGSRYNSAVRYVSSIADRCVALVFSDDGGMDFVPLLPPTLSQAELIARLDELKRLANSPAEPVDREREVVAIDWFEKHQFYMTQKQCEEANQAIGVCEDRFRLNASIWISRTPLKPNAGFVASRDLT